MHYEWTVLAATAGLLGLGLILWMRERRILVLAMAGIGCLALGLFWGAGLIVPPWTSPAALPRPRGGDSSEVLLVVLFLAMVAGMLSHFLFDRFQRPRRRRRKFDWGTFLAPIFTSPIVFLPLAAAFERSGVDLGEMGGSRLIVLLVAFENGFFWKEFMENRWKSRGAE